MTFTKNLLNELKSLKKLEKGQIVAGSLIVLAGLAVASIGVLSLQNSLQEWLTSGELFKAPFDTMMASAISSVLYIFPAVIFFVVAYLVAQSHSLGLKTSISLSVLSIFLGVIWINIPITLAGVLCFLGTEVGFLNRRNISKERRDSPVVTEKIAKFGLLLSGLIGIIILIGMILYITIRGTPYLSWNFITGTGLAPPNLRDLIEGTQQMGISQYLIGSILIVGLSEAIALPLGLGAALYMAEYAPQNKITETIRFFIETLAGAPSIVIALFGFYFIAKGGGEGLGWGISWLSASVCLAFMTLPWNIRVAEEAIKAVPYAFREGAFALGATRWQTIKKIILLSASPGIITGFVLGLGAAFGETTVLILTADTGAYRLPDGLPLTGYGMPTLPVLIYRTYFWNIGSGQPGIDYQWEKTNVAFAASLVLLVIFLAICFASLILRNYMAKKASGK
ncbi:MAG: phosphate ABC transporter permease PstA [Candidatus Bathyarchaeia archaeon]